MPIVIEDKTMLRAPAYSVHGVGNDVVAIDPARPHWIGTDDRGLGLLGRFDGRTPFVQVVRDYANASGLDVTRPSSRSPRRLRVSSDSARTTWPSRKAIALRVPA